MLVQPEEGLVTDKEFGHFLSDVITAGGLVEHGKQCKDLGVRIANFAFRLNTERWFINRALKLEKFSPYFDDLIIRKKP